MRNLEATGLDKVGPSILVESSMVYLGASLHSPKGALELVSCVDFGCEITLFSFGIRLLSKLMRATQAQYNQKEKVQGAMKKTRQRCNKFWGRREERCFVLEARLASFS